MDEVDAVDGVDTPERPNSPGRWLSVMGGFSVTIGGLSLLVAVLCGAAWAMLRLLAGRLPPGHPAPAAWVIAAVGGISLVGGAWFLAAGLTALRGRPSTWGWHMGAAGFRIAAYVAVMVLPLEMAGPTAVGGPASFTHGPGARVLIAVLELIYPVAVLVVFNRPSHRRYLRALRRVARPARQAGALR